MIERIKIPKGAKGVMIIAGEASGDQHGAKVVQAMQARSSNLFFFGIGGQALQAAGVRIFIDAAKLAVVGITEVFSKLPVIIKGLRTAKQLLKTLRPELLILIDFPDFNLNIAAAAKKLNIPVLYYISPQIWAWRSGRVKKIRQRVDHMAVILPFEAAFYAGHHVPVTFVGHPLLDHTERGASIPCLPSVSGGPVIGFLPGSRDQEVMRLFPEMLAAIPLLKQKIPEITFVVSLSPSVKRSLLTSILDEYAPGMDIDIEARGVQYIFAKSTLVVATSGTVTLEAAISGTPFVLVYKVSPLSYVLGRMLIRVKHVGLANLIAEKEVSTELLQQRVTGANIAHSVLAMIQNPAGLSVRRRELKELREKLGGPGASSRVAEIGFSLMSKRDSCA